MSSYPITLGSIATMATGNCLFQATDSFSCAFEKYQGSEKEIPKTRIQEGLDHLFGEATTNTSQVARKFFEGVVWTAGTVFLARTAFNLFDFTVPPPPPPEPIIPLEKTYAEWAAEFTENINKSLSDYPKTSMATLLTSALAGIALRTSLLTQGAGVLWGAGKFAVTSFAQSAHILITGMAFGLSNNFVQYLTKGQDQGEIKLARFIGVKQHINSINEISEGFTEAANRPLVTLGSTALALFAGYLALSYLKQYATHTMGRPTLSRKYQFDDWRGYFYSTGQAPISALSKLVFGEEKNIKPKAPIFKPEIQEQLDDIVFSLRNVQKNKGSYENVILYGPPGTGKTMTAEYIAENCGMNYMEISGGDVAKFIGTKNPPVEELNKVFGRIKSSSKPTVLFIDEFDCFAADRSGLDTPRVEILNTFLNLTGMASNKVLIIAATNIKLNKLDPAAHSRFGDRIYMGPPETKERLAILNMYIDEFFTEDADRAVFSDAYLDKLNAKLEGKTGRTLYKLMNKCYMKKCQQAEGKLTEELIDMILERFLESEKQIGADAA